MLNNKNGFLEIINDNGFFEDLTTRHTRFQLENFVIGQDQAATVWGKYRQVLRELHSRVQNLKNSRYQIRKLEVKIKKLERLLNKTGDELDREDIELDVENEKYNLALMKRDEEEIIREGEVLSNAYNHLKSAVEKELKNKTRDQLEEEFWVEKLNRDIQNAVLSQAGASTGLLNVIRGINNKETSDKILKSYYNAQITGMADHQALYDEAMKLLQNKAK